MADCAAPACPAVEESPGAPATTTERESAESDVAPSAPPAAASDGAAAEPEPEPKPGRWERRPEHGGRYWTMAQPERHENLEVYRNRFRRDKYAHALTVYTPPGAAAAAAAAAAAPAARGALSAGDAAVIHGLRDSPEHNGARATLLEFDATAERWLAERDDDGTQLRIKPANLRKPRPSQKEKKRREARERRLSEVCTSVDWESSHLHLKKDMDVCRFVIGLAAQRLLHELQVALVGAIPTAANLTGHAKVSYRRRLRP